MKKIAVGMLFVALLMLAVPVLGAGAHMVFWSGNEAEQDLEPGGYTACDIPGRDVPRPYVCADPEKL
jgi:hypothetical protein